MLCDQNANGSLGKHDGDELGRKYGRTREGIKRRASRKEAPNRRQAKGEKKVAREETNGKRIRKEGK